MRRFLGGGDHLEAKEKEREDRAKLLEAKSECRARAKEYDRRQREAAAERAAADKDAKVSDD
jgi:hypothetical protein